MKEMTKRDHDHLAKEMFVARAVEDIDAAVFFIMEKGTKQCGRKLNRILTALKKWREF